MKEIIAKYGPVAIVLALGLLSAVINGLLRTRTDEEWVALGETKPRIAGLIKVMRGLFIDPVKVVRGIRMIIQGKTTPAVDAAKEVIVSATEKIVLERTKTLELPKPVSILDVTAIEKDKETK